MNKGFVFIKTAAERLTAALQRTTMYCRRFDGILTGVSSALGVASSLASLTCIVCLLVLFGYDSTSVDSGLLYGLCRVAQIVFLAEILFNLIFRFKKIISESRILKWIVDIGVLLTLLPLLYPRPDNPWIPVLDTVLYSNVFRNTVLAAYSVVELSYAAMRLIGSRTNPSLLMAGSFLFFILVGSFVLMLPKCTNVPLSYTDSLFVSTSAVCITGLTPVDVSEVFTPAGLLVLAVLIQIGGLGVLTFTCFFAIFFSGRTSIYNQLLVRDFIYSRTMSSLIPTLLYVLGFTLVVETLGAFAIYCTVSPEMFPDVSDRIVFSAFHSLSAFCNAGFSNVHGGLSNPYLLDGPQSFYIAVSVIIFAGSIGFPNLVNFKDAVVRRFRRLRCRLQHRRYDTAGVHLIDLNTKLVIATTSVLFLFGTVSFFILEYDNALAGMPLSKKIVQSVFNAITPRSAGYSSVNPAGFMNVTIIMLMLLMWVGGASQSLAGGIKVNSLAAVLLNMRAVVSGQAGASAFRRNLSTDSLRRANAVVIISIVSLFGYVITVMLLEPQMGTKTVVFECVSALFTVGSSLGATPHLCVASKLVLCTAMFLGRVGLISIMSGIIPHRKDPSMHYPTDSIIIN